MLFSDFSRRLTPHRAPSIDAGLGAELPRTELPVLSDYRGAADFFGVSERTVYDWARSEKLKATRLGRAVRFHRDELYRASREGIA